MTNKSACNKLETSLQDFYDINDYAFWCSDEDDDDLYYCKEFIESLVEILDDIIDTFRELYGTETDHDVLSILDREVEGIKDFYYFISSISISNEYGVYRTNKDNIDFQDISSDAEDYINKLLGLIEEDE